MAYFFILKNPNAPEQGGYIITAEAAPDGHALPDNDTTRSQMRDQFSTGYKTPKYKWNGNAVVERSSADRAPEINVLVDGETYRLIREWCKTQPEGCEEAFLNIGIENNLDPRYSAYKAQRSAIIASQSAKKIEV